MTNIAEKSVLAKLLATENIHVEHRKVSTAHFDLETRTLCLPIWKDMSSELYDMLIGHEVGHALETPQVEWKSAIESATGSGFKSFLNVVEDARIEIIMKAKYPGLRRSFYAGYKELYDNNFFKTDGLDLSKLRLIDRMNLHAKVGPFLNIPFSAEEQVFVDRLMTTQTFDDVIALASELYDGAKSEDISDLNDMLEDLANEDDGGDYSDDISEDQSEFSGQESMPNEEDTSEDNEEESAAETSSVEDAADDEEEETSAPSSSHGEEEYNEDPSSMTDEALRENEDRLIDDDARENSYCILPKLNPADWIVGIKTIESLMQFETYDRRPVDAVKNELYANFMTENRKYLSAMTQQFERKKTAQRLKKSKVSKTGKLNMDKIWAHKISEDLFLQSTNIPDGKNHGMVMYLDLSGSMNYRMNQTVEQLVLLAMFCQKINIPFDVYGFINSGIVPDQYAVSINMRNNLSNPINLTINHSGFRLLQLVSTKSSGTKFKNQMKNLLAFGNSYDRRNGVVHLSDTARQHFVLGSTPLEESLIVARHIADKFREDHRIEVLTTVYLTDGAGDCAMYLAGDRLGYINRSNIVIKDEITGKSGTGKCISALANLWRPWHYFDALHDVYEKATGSRIVNFYLSDKYDANNIFRNMQRCFGVDVAPLRREYNKNGCVFIDNSKIAHGFHNQFLINTRNMNARDDEFQPEQNDKKVLIREFKKFQKSKHNNRAIMNKMVDCFV